MLHRTEKEPSKDKPSLLGSKSFSMGVLSNDFAAVDFREKLCYHRHPKKQIRRVTGNKKHNKILENYFLFPFNQSFYNYKTYKYAYAKKFIITILCKSTETNIKKSCHST